MPVRPAPPLVPALPPGPRSHFSPSCHHQAAKAPPTSCLSLSTCGIPASSLDHAADTGPFVKWTLNHVALLFPAPGMEPYMPSADLFTGLCPLPGSLGSARSSQPGSSIRQTNLTPIPNPFPERANCSPQRTPWTPQSPGHPSALISAATHRSVLSGLSIPTAHSFLKIRDTPAHHGTPVLGEVGDVGSHLTPGQRISG